MIGDACHGNEPLEGDMGLTEPGLGDIRASIQQRHTQGHNNIYEHTVITEHTGANVAVRADLGSTVQMGNGGDCYSTRLCCRHCKAGAQ